jgi:hypothetical protein
MQSLFSTSITSSTRTDIHSGANESVRTFSIDASNTLLLTGLLLRLRRSRCAMN